MNRLAICTCIAVTALSLSACNRDKATPPTPTTKPDTITPAPVRPADKTSPAVPGPSTTPTPMPDAEKK